ncbi:MAG: YncE family protein [Acutalibacteraceae bacterium]
MKNLLLTVVCVLLVFLLAACSVKDLFGKKPSKEKVSSLVEETLSEIVVSGENSSAKQSNTSSKKTVANTSSKTPNTGNNSKPTSSGKIGAPPPVAEQKKPAETKKVIKDIVEKLPDDIIPINSQPDNNSNNASSSESEYEPVFGVDYGGFTYEGIFMGVVSKGDFIYPIFSVTNSPDLSGYIIVYNTKTFEVTAAYALPSNPAEIQIIDNGLYISFPKLRSVWELDINNMALVRTIDLPHSVTSFCIDGNKVYYATDMDSTRVYCTDISTQETVYIMKPKDMYPGLSDFSAPKLLLNKEKGLLCIGESKYSNCSLFYYNISDLTLHSEYNLISINHKRTLFLVGDSVIWADRRFDAGNAANLIGRYGLSSFGGLYFANDDFVIASERIYDTETYEPIMAFERLEYLMISEDGSLVIVYSHYPDKVILTYPRNLII